MPIRRSKLKWLLFPLLGAGGCVSLDCPSGDEARCYPAEPEGVGGAGGAPAVGPPGAPPLPGGGAVREKSCEPVKPAFNLAAGGTVTCSHDGGLVHELAGAAFDDNTGTKWRQSVSGSSWISYELAGTDSKVVTTYTITSANDEPGKSDPRDWQFQGSADGPGAATPTWVTLDTREGEAFASRLLTRTFALTNATPYHRYRLLVTANGGGAGVQIAELGLYGPGKPVFSVDDAVEGSGDHQFNYRGAGWNRTRNDSMLIPLRYGQSSTWSNGLGDTATLTFVGSQVKLFGILSPHHGIVGISVDGGPETDADLHGVYTPNIGVYASPMYASPTMCAGRHTLRVRVTGKMGPGATGVYLSLDRAQIVP